MASRPSPPGLATRDAAPLTVTRSRWPRFGKRLAIALLAPTTVAVIFRTVSPRDLAVRELTYLAVVVLIGRLGAVWPPVLAALVSSAAIAYELSPTGSFIVRGRNAQLELLVFLVVSVALARTLSTERLSREQSMTAQQRLEFISEANYLLSRAELDYGETLERLAQLVIPDVADWCTVDVLDEAGRLRTVAFGSSEAINASMVESLRHQSQPRPDAKAGVGAVLRTGRAELYERVDDDVLNAIARDAKHLALLRGLRVTSMMKVPLFMRGKPVGAMTLASVQRRRRFSEDHLALAEDLAARASSAIENAKLYDERVRAARTLQRSLLPPEPPRIPGLELETRFHPYGRGDLVGGDFYDVFELGPDVWVLAIGDVCGKGVEAAVLTGLARHTIRASAMHVLSPRELLEGLNDAILRNGIDRFCTVAVAVLKLGERSLHVTMASGGHPQPILLRARGSSEPLGAPGTLLGVFPEVSLTEVDVDLGAGDSLVFYTDGLLDERLAEPERALAEQVKVCIGLSARAAADRLERDLPFRAQDDRAMVIVRVPDEG